MITNIMHKIYMSAGLILLSATAFLTYVYSTPGTDMQVKWRNSYKQMKRISKTALETASKSDFYPVFQNTIMVAQFIVDTIL